MRKIILFIHDVECKYYVIAGQKFVQEAHYSRSGDVIHPQLRCGSGYETSREYGDSDMVQYPIGLLTHVTVVAKQTLQHNYPTERDSWASTPSHIYDVINRPYKCLNNTFNFH